MSEQIDGLQQTEGDEPVKLTEAERRAKVTLDNAVADLQKAAQGTTMIAQLSFQLLIMQVDVLIDLMAELKLFPREEFFKRITVKVEAMASECRRAVLAQGGASALAGLKKPS